MDDIAQLSPVMLGFIGSLLAGLMTSVGAIPVLFGKTPTRKWRDISLGFAAGVMLAASFFSLIRTGVISSTSAPSPSSQSEMS